ncbi:MAG: HAD hydrolase-like protein [Bryobacteraceae bacterium]|nr:HAD hydrolase-like protein [Bryobacteraceae bacterium]
MRQHLIVDADDTLWENNIYFERAFAEFVELLNHSTLTPTQIRSILDEIELANIKVHGYGSRNFGRNMRECYLRLAERHILDGDLDRVIAIAERILDEPIVLIDGVRETLEYLATRHDLTLFTKGLAEEQKLKIDRSGLGIYFGHTAIVKEKDVDSYRQLVASRGMDAERTWMVGNSPKSDIKPALMAGIGAVYVPHARTWHLEREDVEDGHGRLLIIERFSGLRDYF